MFVEQEKRLNINLKPNHCLYTCHLLQSFNFLCMFVVFTLQVVGKGVLGSMGIVMSINEQEGIAAVKFPSCEYKKSCKASDILTVPISRLSTPRSEVNSN